jgi:hypothetical protein
MSGILNYTPGQVVTFYQEVKDGYDQRTNDGYTPVVTRIILPCLTLSTGYPVDMTYVDVGLYYFQFQLPGGAASVGTYFIDIVYMNPDTQLLVNDSRQVIVTAPYGNFGTFIGQTGPGQCNNCNTQPLPCPPPCPPFPPSPCHPFPYDHDHRDGYECCDRREFEREEERNREREHYYRVPYPYKRGGSR